MSNSTKKELMKRERTPRELRILANSFSLNDLIFFKNEYEDRVAMADRILSHWKTPNEETNNA